jgi:amino acid transporter
MAYFIAGVSAFLSSLCYSEYAVEFPVAGGSFTFILYTFGEFWAWITATNLIFNYGKLQISLCHAGAGFCMMNT